MAALVKVEAVSKGKNAAESSVAPSGVRGGIPCDEKGLGIASFLYAQKQGEKAAWRNALDDGPQSMQEAKGNENRADNLIHPQTDKR
ncbi:MAG: hypothetical protein KIPDCIKN_03370 [Haliscomenobacter sp.]|nr:hypothetical protein [Haliscomenobacter sp.]